MPSKPSYGPKIKNRAFRLLKALLSFASGDLNDCEHLNIKYRWEDRDSGRPQLVVETKLRVLEVLTSKDGYEGKLTKDQIRVSLYAMKDFLGILTDNRTQPRGKEEWHFTLKLWSTDLQRNLSLFEQEWQRLRSPKSMLQEASSTAPTNQHKPTGPVPGVPFLAPPLPSHFVSRPEVSQELKLRLLSDETTQTGVLVVSAIYGLGGIGKSTLAAALARDQDVRKHFPDGVFWATLGQQPDLLSCLSCWILELRDFDFKPTTPQAASLHLRTLLLDKRALLVVDDVWSPDDFEFFRVGSAGCRILVTTREAPIKHANRYSLDVMTPDQALELLRLSFQDQLTDQEVQLALALAKRVGYLPLALQLAAVQVAEGVSWQLLLDDLNREIAYLETLSPGIDPTPGCEVYKDHCLLASLNLSLRRLRNKQRERFAWLGVLPEDVSLTPQGMMTVWQLEEFEARNELRYFKSKALLLSGSPFPDGTPTYRLHDLLHDIARRLLTAPQVPECDDRLPGLGLTLPVAHARLLDRYRAKSENGLWHTLRDDGYFHAHLSWHLLQADRVDELHQLLQGETDTGRNAWFDACDRLGQPAIFVKDVAIAWEHADGAFESDPCRAIGLQCRYALIVSSLNSLASKIPAKLMAGLVDHGLWTPAQGLAYARQVQEPRDRARALRELAGQISEILLPEALSMAGAIQSEEYRAETLSALAPHLSENLLAEALSMAGAIKSEYLRAEAIRALAPHLSENLLAEALSTARAIKSEKARAYVLSALAAHVPEILPEALSTAGAILDEYRRSNAGAILDEYYRARALRSLAPHLSENLLAEALSTAGAILDEDRRARALSALAPHLSENLLAETLFMAGAILDEYWRAFALRDLAPHLSENLLAEALSTAGAILDEYWRAFALNALAPCLSENLLAEALSTAGTMQSEKARAFALNALAPHLSENLLPEALSTARAIKDECSRAEALSDLAPHFPEILPEALSTARMIQEKYSRASAISALAPHFPEILPEALSTARVIQDVYFRAKAIRALATHLSENLLPEALSTAGAILDENARAEVLSALAPHLSENLLTEAFSTAEAILDEKARAEVLRALAPHLSENLLPEALSTAEAILDEKARAEVLRALAPHLPENLLPEALSTARAIKDEYLRAEALRALAPHLIKNLLPEALSTAEAILEENARAFALIDLAPHLSENLLAEALSTARAIKDEYLRAYALRDLAPHLSENLLAEALSTARAIKDEYLRAYALRVLAPHLSENLLAEALSTARAIKDEYRQAEAISALAPNLSENLLAEALSTARAIKDEYRQAEAISALAPHLSENLLPEALSTARAIKDEYSRAKALSALASHLPEILPEALSTARAIKDEKARADALRVLAPHLSENLLPEALSTAEAIQSEEARAEALSALAAHLPENLLAEAISTARKIQEPYHRSHAFSGIARELKRLPANFSLWQETLHILVCRRRSDFLEDLAELVPVIIELGGVKSLPEIVRAIIDVGQQWP